MGLFIIAVIVLLICVCVSRIGSLDLREVAVAVEIVFSIATVGAAISLPFAITRNIQIIGKHAVLKETLEATDRKNYYLISSDVLRLNYTIMNHRNFVDNFWIGIWTSEESSIWIFLFWNYRNISKTAFHQTSCNAF